MPSSRTKPTRSSARSTTSQAFTSVRTPPKSRSKPTTLATKAGSSSRRSAVTSSTSNQKQKGKIIYKDDETEKSSSSEEDDDGEEAYGEEEAVAEEEEDAEVEEDEVDSDDIDESDESEEDTKSSSRKRKSTGKTKTPPSKKAKNSSNGHGKGGKGKDTAKGKGKETVVKKNDDVDYSDYSDNDDDDDIVLEEGQAIAGRIYPAPTTGKVPPGQISRNSFKFLVNLQDPEKNDRTWFQAHDPAFRLAEKEWKAFVEALIPRMCETDNELSPWPARDLIHRIYRDVRFSNDKTPYKRNFSMSLTRSGRKGIWAGFSPNNKSILAAGIWGPEKNELASLRHAVQTNPTPLRDAISAPEFVKLFGPARPDARGKGKRCNVFGHEDALKTAPKGVDKSHPDIDLLKLRSWAVVHTFEDKEVLAPGFMDNLISVLEVVTPFVHMINNCIALPPASAADE